jgi:predicted Rossmann-fold nucleotide-binding protein
MVKLTDGLHLSPFLAVHRLFANPPYRRGMADMADSAARSNTAPSPVSSDDLEALVRSTMSALTDQLLPDSDGDRKLDNRDLIRSLLRTTMSMAADALSGNASRLDLKIAASALTEMRDGYLMLGPHRHRQKVTIFGSARTQSSDPLYVLTRDVAAAMAANDWMVVTGAGPGIMAAGLEGAGREHALGVAIRLPFESEANTFVHPENLVDMRYFFTRKLALLRLDEAFELLTLVQTGKAEPVPIVFLGLGHGFWTAWKTFVEKVVEEGYISSTDMSLFTVTNSVEEAVQEITGFYRNYHSLRWSGDTLILRLHRAPTVEQLVLLNTEFGMYAGESGIVASAPLAAELADHDHLDLARITLQFNRRQPGRLRLLIDACNQF